MDYFLKSNKTAVSYLLIFLLIIPIFGFNFLLNIIGNLLLLLLLVPLLLLIVLILSFNSLKSKINSCSNCGSLSFNVNNKCMNCGFDFQDLNNNKDTLINNPGERTIEIKAEEV